MPEDAPWAEPVFVPDDIRELQPDIDAYHRELRLARRRRRWARLSGSRAWQRWSFPVGVVTGALALAALVFGVLAVDGGTARPTVPAAAPLAHPDVAPGEVGGLLPATQLTFTDGVTRSSTALRPALVALLPPHCSCTSLLDHLAAQADEVQIRLVVIGPAAPDAEIAALPGQLHRGAVVAGYDSGAALATAYDAHGVTALVVARDGVVSYLQRDVTSQTRLELPLQAALLVGSGAGS